MFHKRLVRVQKFSDFALDFDRRPRKMDGGYPREKCKVVPIKKKKASCGHRENAMVSLNRLNEYRKAVQGVKIHLALLFTT